MFTVYFNAKQERGHGLTPAEIKASDVINVGMLEEVTEEGLCSWHDIETEADVEKVRAWIAGNLGNFTVDIVRENIINDVYFTEENVETGVKCVSVEWIAEERRETVKLTEKGVDSVTAIFKTMESALAWAAGTVAGRLHRSAGDFEAVPEQIAPGLWEVRVIEL